MALDQLGKSTSRRTIVTTGAKMAYAAPVVAASFKLSGLSAGAVSPGGECKTFVCGSGLCAGGGGVETSCACFETVKRPGFGICNGDFFCVGATPCLSDDDCGGGTCVTNTCCGPNLQLCAPKCNPGDGLVGGESTGGRASGN